MATEEFAPAKVNLALHVTGRRADGYHLLDSLVVFAGVGDTVRAEDAPELSLTLDGPMAAGLAVEGDNLVLRAARFLGVAGAALRLTKRLPVASGIGGGSADAAATIRALCRLSGRALPEPAAAAVLGADVPVCLVGRPARMSGIGEVLAELPPLPPVWLVLANPGVAVPTPAIFAALGRRADPPPPATPNLPAMPDLPTARALADYLATCRNDLEPPAHALQPVIGTVLEALVAQPGCLMARMSGSGATCFGLFEAEADARTAADAIRVRQPDWWVAATPVLS